jgi:hypothetical protein
LKGKQSTDSRLPDCQQLALKLFAHAATIYQLRQGTKISIPYSIQGVFFYDFGSVAVLTRAVIETYLTLFEVFFEPATDDEFEFNHALWQLSGFIIREKFPSSDPNFEKQVSRAQEEIREIKIRLQRTEKFNSLTRKQQKDILKGNRRRDWKKVAKTAGFGHQTVRQMYAYYSGYVHADALSGVQLMGAETAQDQIEFIEIYMHTVMIILAKMVVEYSKKFSEAKAVCDKNPDVFYAAKVASQAISVLP